MRTPCSPHLYRGSHPPGSPEASVRDTKLSLEGKQLKEFTAVLKMSLKTRDKATGSRRSAGLLHYMDNGSYARYSLDKVAQTS